MTSTLGRDWYKDKVGAEPPEPGDRKEWILKLLYCPNKVGDPTPIYGITRMMKSTFLVHRHLEDKFGVSTDFNFRADKYGPLDPGVYVALGELEKEGMIHAIPPEEHSEKYDEIKFVLTNEGTVRGRDLYSELTDRQKKMMSWVKYDKVMTSLGTLLAYVYSEYPEMTEESVLTS
jgi:hypothetical protein